MKYFPEGTVRSYLAIPHVTPQNLASLPLTKVVGPVQTFWKNNANVKTSPDVSAVEFYTLDHLAAKIQGHFDPDEPLPPWARKVMERYVDVLSAQAQRLYVYLLLTITRESRHLHSAGTVFKQYNLPPEYQTFWGKITGGNSIAVAEKLLSDPPDMPLGEYVQCVRVVFNHGSFSTSYGGKPWGNIAYTLERAVKGETSLLTMVDTAFTLAHNTGPVFNKGMVYHTQSSEFLKVLDVQRSGQMPEAVLTGVFSMLKLPGDLAALVQTVKENIPGSIGDSVDWVKVKKDGKGKYKVPTAPTPPPPPPKKVTFHGKPAKLTGVFNPLPNVSIPMVERTA